MRIPYCPFSPMEHQKTWLTERSYAYTFLSCRNGGKSLALLMAALQDIEVPGYTAVIFYRNSSAYHHWLDEVDRWWEDDNRLRYHAPGSWTFPHGSMLCLKVLPSLGESSRYQTVVWDFIGFEDVDTYSTQDRKVEMFLASRARGAGARIRSTYNGFGDPILSQWDG